MSNWNKNDFESVTGREIIRVENRNQVKKKENGIYIVNKKGREEGKMEWGKESV